VKVTRCHWSALLTCAAFVGAIAFAETSYAACKECGTVSDVKTIKKEGEGSGVGAVAGGVAGNAIEQGTTMKQGLEITVKLDNGELRAITQDADESFRPGERVRLLSGGGVTRVTH